MTSKFSWVIGGSGLLGSAVQSALNVEKWEPRQYRRFSWDNPDALREQFQASVAEFLEAIPAGIWRIFWCAGAGVVGASEEKLKQETQNLSTFLEVLGNALVGRNHSDGLFFLASSAGGLYAGSSESPATELTIPVPINSYGWAKLDQELLVHNFSNATNTPVFVGRIANLYGPGQNVKKPQGLISQICLSILQQRSCTIYVPLETSRDYLYSADAGQIICRCCDILQSGSSLQTSLVITKIIASGHNSTISQIIGECRRVTKRPLRVASAVNKATKQQPKELRFQSLVLPNINARTGTSIPVGINSVFQALLTQVQHGEISSGR